MIATAPDITDDIRLLEPSEPFRIELWHVLLAVAVIAALWWYIRWQRARKGAQVEAKVAEQAQEDALAALEALFALVEREESRPYATESSAIIRRYIEARFGLSAPRRSTEEFLNEAQHSPRLAAEHRASLGDFLRICDLLKFGRTHAVRAELAELHDAAVRFVKETRLTPAVVTP